MGGVAYNLQQFFYTKVSRIDRLTAIHVNDNLGNNKQYTTEQEAKIYVVRQCVYIHEKMQFLINTLIMKLQVQYK